MKLKTSPFIFLLVLAVSCSDDDSKPSKPNTAPAAENVKVLGTQMVGATLTGDYTYVDADDDAESGSTYQWYWKAEVGAAEIPISGATGLTYIVPDEKLGALLSFGISPRAAKGVNPGVTVISLFTNPIAEQTELTFVYNGNTVTYGVITSERTSRKWFDRNLGAANTPTSVTDWANYGDVFQWGRGADGHQLVTRTSADISIPSPPATQNPLGVAAIGTTANPVYSTTDNPGHAFFIITPTYVGGDFVPDWRSPKNDDLWAAPARINNPCPPGWHVPTYAEFYEEGLTSVQDGFNILKLTYTHVRAYDYADASGGQSWSDQFGSYWTSESYSGGSSPHLRLNATEAYMNYSERAYGMPCRCIKGQ